MNTAEYRSSRLLTREGFRHAFFTRRGGFSPGPYQSLNFSSAATDTTQNVAENLRRAALVLGVDPVRVYFLSQVHGTAHRQVSCADDREAVLFERGDIVVGSSPELACGVRTADCVPVLVADCRSGVAAAIHAGWQGVESGAVGAGVAAVRSLAGADGELRVAVGPHISLAAFEVGDDVAARLLASSPDPDVIDRSFGERPHVDLRRIVHAQLAELGVSEEHIDDVLGCTVGEPEELFSYRRDGKASGRHLSAIVPRGSG